MRWRLGGSSATACLKRKSALDDVIATSTEAGNTPTTDTASGVRYSRPIEGSSELVATEAIETRGGNDNEFVHVTADAFLPFGGRSGNDDATERPGRSRARDSLSLSAMSFVENLTPRRRPRAFLPEDAQQMSSSAGTDLAIGAYDDWKSCPRGAANNAVSTASPSVGVNNSESEEAAAVRPSSSSALPYNKEGRQEDPLIHELHDHILRCGVLVDPDVVLGSARVCLDLMLSREMSMEAMRKTGPAELISLAKTSFGISTRVGAVLLAQLVGSESSASRLADSHLLRPSNATSRSIRQVGVEEGDGDVYLRQNARERITSKAGQGAKAAEAAMALSEACRTWRDTIEAVNSRAERATCCERSESQKAGPTVGAARGGLPREGAEHPLCSTPSLRSLESPRGRCHLLTGRASEASAAKTGTVDVPRQLDEDQRPSGHLRSAIRMVTSGAKDSYGQLVVLGYKVPNGVRIGRSDIDGVCEVRRGRGGGGGSNGVGAVQESNNICGPLCQRHTLGPCQVPTRENPLRQNDMDGGGSSGSGCDVTLGKGVGCGNHAQFQTPNTTPSRRIQSRGGVCAPRRARDACGRAGTINAGTDYDDGKVCGHGNEDGSRRDRGKRNFSSNSQREGKPVAVAERGVSAHYQVQLSLSSQQREEAENVENAECGAPKTQATGKRRKDMVEIPCFAEEGCDMYQLGRMQAADNDFVVKGPLHKSQPGGKVCGPVSRYAVRFLVDRSPPHRCTIFAGGFNSRRCLTLPKCSPKWLKENGDWDAVTPFGIRILKPEVGEWREVTVTGDMRRTRIGRLDNVGDLIPGETNELTSGTVVDVGGVQMLYESAERMAALGGVQPSRVIELLNGRKPQCPVQLQTLRFKPFQPAPRRPTTSLSEVTDAAIGEGADTPDACGSGVLNGIAVTGTRGDVTTTLAAMAGAEASHAAVGADSEDEGGSTDAEGGGDEDVEAKARVPHVFPACGHVQGYAKQLARGPCPMCRAPGPLVEILFGWCQAIDREVPSVVFNPCGHAASLEVAERWSRSKMPNNAPPDAVYRPICPYCAKPLQCKNGERPYSKMIFAL